MRDLLNEVGLHARSLLGPHIGNLQGIIGHLQTFGSAMTIVGEDEQRQHDDGRNHHHQSTEGALVRYLLVLLLRFQLVDLEALVQFVQLLLVVGMNHRVLQFCVSLKGQESVLIVLLLLVDTNASGSSIHQETGVQSSTIAQADSLVVIGQRLLIVVLDASQVATQGEQLNHGLDLVALQRLVIVGRVQVGSSLGIVLLTEVKLIARLEEQEIIVAKVRDTRRVRVGLIF